MPPKKKASKKGSENEPDLLEELTKRFRKAQKDNEAPRFAEFDKILAKIEEEGGEIPIWIFHTDLDLLNFRLLSESLVTSGYRNVRSLRFFRLPTSGDEIARVLTDLLHHPTCALEELVISDCNLTSQGCGFLGNSLRVNKSLNSLRLDFNSFGSSGAALLCDGLASNASLRQLSLAYCDLDASCSRPLNFVLLFVNGRLEDLSLRGNRLGNLGLVDLLTVGLVKTRKLRSLNVACNGLNDVDEELVGKLVACMRGNDKLEKYWLTGNQLSDGAVSRLISTVAQQAKHVKFLQIPETCSAGVFDSLDAALGGPKKAKKKPKK